MNFQYKITDIELEAYTGKLNKDVNLIEEVNKLYWIDKSEDFFDMEKYASEGNIGHMLEQVEFHKEKTVLTNILMNIIGGKFDISKDI